MEFSGNNNRKIGSAKRLSFYASGLTFDNIEGTGALGFSGEWEGTGRSLEFSFDKGKIIDPENRYIYSYLPSQSFSLSGDIYDSNYQYFIDGVPICYVGVKEKNVIDNFYINTSGCTATTSFYVASDKPSYTILKGDSFSKTGTLNINVANNNANLPFVVFSGVFSGGDNFSTTNLPIKIENNANIIVSGRENITTGDYSDELTFKTSVGDIKTDFVVKLTD
jgi:hypothetical protein